MGPEHTVSSLRVDSYTLAGLLWCWHGEHWGCKCTRKTYSPEISHAADGVKLNPTFTSRIHKQVSHGFSVVVGA